MLHAAIRDAGFAIGARQYYAIYTAETRHETAPVTCGLALCAVLSELACSDCAAAAAVHINYDCIFAPL